MARIDDLRRLGLDSWLRQRGVPPFPVIWGPVVALLVIVQIFDGLIGSADFTIQTVIGTAAVVLYAGRRRSLRWSRRETVRALVWQADCIEVAIPSYGYWRHAENLWRRGHRVLACGYALIVFLLSSALIMSTCGLGALALIYVSGLSGAANQLRSEVDSALLGGRPGSAAILARDLDDMTTRRGLAHRSLDAARGEIARAEQELTQARALVEQAEEQMHHLRRLQQLDPADQAVIAEIRATERGVVATMTGIDQRLSGDSIKLDRKSMWLWVLALVLSIPANILATMVAIRMGIGG